MERTLSIQTAAGPRPAVTVRALSELDDALAALGLEPPRPVIALVGGAAGLDADADALRPLFDDAIAPVADERGACVVDGGTDSGVMRLMGGARAASAAAFPLVGVVVEALVSDREAQLDPNHSHFVLVAGSDWGDESPWLAAVAGAMARERPAVTVVVDGGDIAWTDVEESIRAGRPVIAVRGGGRTADELAAGASGDPADERAVRLAETGLVTVSPADAVEVRRAIDRTFDRGG